MTISSKEQMDLILPAPKDVGEIQRDLPDRYPLTTDLSESQLPQFTEFRPQLLFPDRRGYPPEDTYLFSGDGFTIYAYITMDSRVLRAYPDGVHRIQTTRRIRLDNDSYVYVWRPEIVSMFGRGLDYEIIDSDHNWNSGFGLYIGHSSETKLGGFVKTMDKHSERERLFEVEATFSGNFGNYKIVSQAREIPPSLKLLAPVIK